MKRISTYFLIGCIAATAGCSLIPSSFHIFGDPASRLESRQKKEEGARGDAYKKAQELVHKTQDALDKAAPTLEVKVAQDFNGEAVALLDQALGPSMIGDLEKWQKQVDQLCSADESVRAKAELQRSKERQEVSRISARLAEAIAATSAAEAKNLEYEKIKIRQSDLLLKAGWLIGILVGVYVTSQVLSLASRFVPALAPFAAVVNGIAAPALSYSFNRAKAGLTQVGTAMAQIRTELPTVAEHVADILTQHVDSDHKKAIASAATSAGAPPPA